MKNPSTSSKLNKKGLFVIVLGVFFVIFSVLLDSFRLGQDSDVFGAAQILGVETGIALVLLGAGFFLSQEDSRQSSKNQIPNVFARILDLPILFWFIFSFLLLYIFFFMQPLFFSGTTIKYFYKYIPDAWTPYIGFDIKMTVDHIHAWLINGTSPYADGVVPYTPLTLTLFIPFIMIGYPAYYKVLSILTVLSYALSVFVLSLPFMRNKKHGILAFLGGIGFFSYTLQFEIERGQFNMIAFALILLAIYLYHFQHNYRFFAYLLFSVSVQLKLYPLVFMLMFVKNWRDWKQNLVRFAGLGLTNFALLFVLGVQNFQDFITHIILRMGMQSSRYEDLSISGFTYQLTEETQVLPVQLAPLVQWIFLVIFTGVILVIIFRAYKNDEEGFNSYLFFFATLGGLMIPAASFDYKLSFFAIPMSIFLSSLSRPQKTRDKILFTALIFLLSLAYWSTLYPYEANQAKPFFLARNSTALLVIFFLSIPVYFLQKRQSKTSFPK